MRWLKTKVAEVITPDVDSLARIFDPAALVQLHTRIDRMPIWRRAEAVRVARSLGQAGMTLEDIIGPGFDVVFGLTEGQYRMDPEHAAEAVACVCAVGNLQGGKVNLARTVVEVCVRGR